MFSAIKRSHVIYRTQHAIRRRSHSHQIDFSKQFNSILSRAEHMETSSNIMALKNISVYSKFENAFVSTLEKMKADGFNPDAQFPVTKKHPLHMSVARSYLVSAALLEVGAYVDKYNRSQSTPLFVATTFGHENIVKLLVNSGANVKKRTDPKNTAVLPIHRATDVKIIEFLLEHGSPINSMANTDIASNCLQYNVLCLNPECVELLVEKGAQDLPNSKGVTAYSLAIYVKKTWSQEPYSEEQEEVMQKVARIINILKPLKPIS